MLQLKFDDNFQNIVPIFQDYWKSIDDIPPKIKDYITNHSASRPLYDRTDKKYYCSQCLRELSGCQCINCQREYQLKKSFKVFQIQDLDSLEVTYRVFDVIDQEAVLYYIVDELTFDHPLASYKYRTNKMKLSRAYHVQKDGLLELYSHKFYSFKSYDEALWKDFDENGDFSLIDISEIFGLSFSSYDFLYVDNLDDLQDVSVYRYSRIWEMKDKWRDDAFVPLSAVTYNPICRPEFEYLVKMKLYQLAEQCETIKWGDRGSFEKIFGVSKKYYNFMVEHDINASELSALQQCPTDDYELLSFVTDCLNTVIQVDHSVDFKKLKKYFDEQHLRPDHFVDYQDYLNCCQQLGIDLKDKNVLYPEDFITSHDQLTLEVMINDNAEINQKISELSKLLSLNVYENDKFIIFPADGIASLIDESSQQSNCVRTYCDRISQNDCQIYFMRHKTAVDKSLVTVEVRAGRVVQARTRFNKDIDAEMKTFLEQWEKVMFPIIKISE